jgi:hypothetical protein
MVKKTKIIKSVYDNQEDILKAIITLHCPKGFELDPTYSKGNFYKKGIPEPKYKFDIRPVSKKIKKASSENLPFKNEEINSIIWDPPFVAAIQKHPGIIAKRFGSYRTIQNELWPMYHRSLAEFYRILNKKGILIVKCQDTIDAGKQYFSHVEIINYAISLGFYPKDMFVLIAKNRIIGPYKKQQHARKYHSYFIIFEKKEIRVQYAYIKVGDKNEKK